MNNEIKVILDKLNIDPKFFSELENASIEKVLVYGEIGKIKLILKNDTNITLELYEVLTSSLKNFFGGKEVYLYLNVDRPNNNYFKGFACWFESFITKDLSFNSYIFIFNLNLFNKGGFICY